MLSVAKLQFERNGDLNRHAFDDVGLLLPTWRYKQQHWAIYPPNGGRTKARECTAFLKVMIRWLRSRWVI